MKRRKKFNFNIILLFILGFISFFSGLSFGASPFTWNLTLPANTDPVNIFPALYRGDIKGTVGGSPSSTGGIIGTLQPYGTANTGWRENQINDDSWICQNAYYTTVSSASRDSITLSTLCNSFELSTNLFRWLYATGAANPISSFTEWARLNSNIFQLQQGAFGQAGQTVGNVTLTSQSGSMGAGTYIVGVVPVYGNNLQGEFDFQGYSQSNSIVLGANSAIKVTWTNTVSTATGYAIYVQNAGQSYYNRYFLVSGQSITTYTVNSTILGGPVGTLTITPSITGGALSIGNYIISVRAVFADGETIDQAANGNNSTFKITSGSTGSAAVSWTAITGATSYKVFVDYAYTTGSIRTHQRYFTTSLTSITVTGNETYLIDSNPVLGDTETDNSSALVASSIISTSNATSWFNGDIKLNSAPNGTNDAAYIANKFLLTDNTFGGLDLRAAGNIIFRLGLNGPNGDFVITNRGTEVMRCLDTLVYCRFPNATGIAFFNAAGNAVVQFGLDSGNNFVFGLGTTSYNAIIPAQDNNNSLGTVSKRWFDIETVKLNNGIPFTDSSHTFGSVSVGTNYGQKFSNGLIWDWGETISITGSSNTSVTFNTPFTNNPSCVVTNNNTTVQIAPRVANVITQTMTVYNDSASATQFNYMCMGN